MDYNDTRYYRPEDDRSNAINKHGLVYERPVASLEPFKILSVVCKEIGKAKPISSVGHFS